MFKQKANIPFISAICDGVSLCGMHATMIRLYKAAEELKGVTGQTNVAILLGESPQALNNWESRGMSKRAMITAQQRIGCSAVWLETETGQMKYSQSLAPGELLKSKLARPGHIIEVPIMNAAGSMGDGDDTPDGDVIVDVLRLKIDWIRENVRSLTSTSNLSFIHALGHSMEPTIYSGDILLVDSGIKMAATDGVYVLRAHGRIFIKTVRQRIDGAFEISSDNPSIKTAEVLNGDHEVEILGRVVYAWHGKRLL